MSNDRYVVAVNACMNAGNVDMIGYWMMNLKWRGMGLYMIRSHSRGTGVNMEWKSTGSCYQVTSNRPGWFVQKMDETACQAIQKPAFEMCLCVCVLCQSWLNSTMEVCDIWSMTIPMNHWPVQTLYKTSLFLSETLKIRSVWEKKDDNYFPCFTWPSYLFLLWSFAGLLVGFLSEDWSDNTRLTPTIM